MFVMDRYQRNRRAREEDSTTEEGEREREIREEKRRGRWEAWKLGVNRQTDD